MICPVPAGIRNCKAVYRFMGNRTIRQMISTAIEILPRSLQKLVFCGLLSLSMLVVHNSGFAQTNDLPELGDSATQYLDSAQAKQIGQGFFRQLIRSNLYLEDYELQDYLQSLGDRIGMVADLRGTLLTFSLLKNNTLNAFAVPGGYITFHTGLIMATETESELASVTGHEIAHLTQRHLPRLIARANENKIPTIAAIIGSILLGGQAGLAGLTMTSATLASNQLSYTREFEREADAIGIQMLADAQYDPNAMAQFFGSLERFTRHDSTEIPEFLRTHPLSYTRVAESEARASEYPPQPHESSFEFYLAKAKIVALYSERKGDPLLYFKDLMESDQSNIRDAAHYGTAVVLTKSRKFGQARAILQPLGERYPSQAWIQSAIAENDLADNKPEDAIARYEALIDNNPGKPYLHYQLANAYLANQQPELAKKSLRYQIRRHPERYLLYHFLSRANADLGKLAEAHQADAEYKAALGDYAGAAESLKLALREAGSEGYLTQSISARLQDLEEKVVLQNKTRKG